MTAGSLLALDSELQTERIPETSLSYEVDLSVELWQPDLREPLEDVSRFVELEGSSISYSERQKVRHTAQLRWNGQVDWNRYRLKLLVTLRNLETNETLTESLGFYVVDSWTEILGTDPPLYETQCSDLLAILDVPISETFVVQHGTSYRNAITNALNAASRWDRWTVAGTGNPVGLSAAVALDGRENHVVRSRVWAVTQNHTWLDILSYLCEGGGYRSPYLRRDGVVAIDATNPKAETIGLPEDEHAAIAVGARHTIDLTTRPNQWVVFGEIADPEISPPGEPDTLILVTTDSEAADGVHSFESRGRRLLRRVYVVDAGSTEDDVAVGYSRSDAFARAAGRLIDQDRESVESIRFRLAPLASLWHGEVMYLPDIGVSGRWRVTDWRLPLNGETMDCQAVKV